MPDVYKIALDAPLTFRASPGGSPLYTTRSPKVTVMLIVLPAPYGPSGVADVTLATAGPVVLTTMALEYASEPGPPGAGSVRLAVFPARSTMLPVRAVSL